VHRARAVEIASQRRHGGALVGSELGREAAPIGLREPGTNALGEHTFHRVQCVREPVVRHLDRDAARATPDPIARHHADLEGEQLVEREACERGLASLGVRRIVRRLQRDRDRLQPGRLGAVAQGAEILRVRVADCVERGADRSSQPVGRDPLGEAVHGHDAADGQRVRAGLSELGILEARQPALRLNLARQDHLVARRQATFDEAAPEPHCLGLPRVVAQARDRALDLATERGRHVKRDDAHARRHLVLGGAVAQVSKRHELGEVVVAARQVKQQVADGLDADAAQPARHRGRDEAARGQRRVRRRRRRDRGARGRTTRPR
jgi:hypothetical protein